MPTAGSLLSRRYGTALVTGAASGLGRALASALLQEELTVYGTSRQPDRPGRDEQVHFLPMEGASAEAMDHFIRDQGELLNSVDILINNSGHSLFGDWSRTPEAELERLHYLLLVTPMRLIRAVLPGMRERRHGIVVNVSSVAAELPLPYMAAYSSGKAGLSALTRSLMLTEVDSGVCFVDFQPGDLRTRFNRNMERLDPLTRCEAGVFSRMERLLEASPGPETAAGDLMRALRKGRSGVVRSGGWFQTRMAPLGARLLPTRWLLGAIRRYYGLPKV